GLFLLAHELGLGSSSAAEVTVPTVINKSEADATGMLKAQGLKVKVESAENDAQAGTVFDQNPKPEAKAHKGDTVTIFVSKGPPGGAKGTKGSTVTMIVSSGPAPTTTEPSTSTTSASTAQVPDVTTKTRNQAFTMLSNDGFTPANGNCATGGSVVTSQNPAGN